MTTAEQDLKQAVKENTLVIGSRSVIKKAKTGKIKTIIHASNCPNNLLMELENLKKVAGIEIKKFPDQSDKLGESCKKPFNILMAGIKK